MNICVWSSGSFEKPYASWHLMKDIVAAILNKGHEVWLIQKKYAEGELPEELQEYLEKGKLHIINIPWKGQQNFFKRYLTSIKYYRVCEKVFRKIPNIDVIFLQSNNVAFFPVTFAYRKKVPIVYNVQDIFPMDALAVGKLCRYNPAFIVMRWMMKRAYKKADRVITISDDMAHSIMEEGRKDVDVIYNWSYQNQPYCIRDEDNHFLQTYGIKREDGFRVVYAGNVGQMMDTETLVQTAVLLKSISEIKFYVIGTGSRLEYLKRRIKEEKIENVCLFPSQPMKYAPDNYCMADVNINPVSKGVMYTCMPSKTNTCLLSLKPTIVSMDLESDMAKKLSKVDLWKIVAPGDSRAMADAIKKIYEGGIWEQKSKNADVFMKELGPVENAYNYVRILEEVGDRQIKYEKKST